MQFDLKKINLHSCEIQAGVEKMLHLAHDTRIMSETKRFTNFFKQNKTEANERINIMSRIHSLLLPENAWYYRNTVGNTKKDATTANWYSSRTPRGSIRVKTVP